jgi:hypothetical protein
MAKKRRYQEEPAVEKVKKAKGGPVPRRKRRKLAHAEEKAEGKANSRGGRSPATPRGRSKVPVMEVAGIEEEEEEYMLHEDEIDVDTSTASFLHQLDPSLLSSVPTFVTLPYPPSLTDPVQTIARQHGRYDRRSPRKTIKRLTTSNPSEAGVEWTRTAWSPQPSPKSPPLPLSRSLQRQPQTFSKQPNSA